MLWKFIFFVLISAALISRLEASAAPTTITGEDILTGKSLTVSLDKSKKKALLIVFLSAACPCSNSHLNEIKELGTKYPEFEFVGMHSNTNENNAFSKQYFAKAALPFPVIEDDHWKYADEFKAFKTPHAFLIHPQGKILFQGGLTDSADCAKAKKHFLADALEQVSKNQEVAVSNARTLGCVIQRENEKNVW